MSNRFRFKYIWNYKDFDATLMAISYITFWPLIIQDVLYLLSTVLEQGDCEGSFIGLKNFHLQVLALYLKIK